MVEQKTENEAMVDPDIEASVDLEKDNTDSEEEASEAAEFEGIDEGSEMPVVTTASEVIDVYEEDDYNPYEDVKEILETTKGSLDHRMVKIREAAERLWATR